MAGMFDIGAAGAAIGSFGGGVGERTRLSGAPIVMGHGFRPDDRGRAVSISGDRNLPWLEWDEGDAELVESAGQGSKALGLWLYRRVVGSAFAWHAFYLYRTALGVGAALVVNNQVHRLDVFQVADVARDFAAPISVAMPLRDEGRPFVACPVNVAGGERTAFVIVNGFAPPIVVEPFIDVEGEFGDAGRPRLHWKPLRFESGGVSGVAYLSELFGAQVMIQNMQRFVLGGFTGADRQMLYVSDAASYSIWGAESRVVLPMNPGDRVVAAANLNEEELIVFTRERVLFVRAQQGLIEEGVVEVLSASAGCVATNSVAQGRDGLYWLGRQGVYRLRGGRVEEISSLREYFGRRMAPGQVAFANAGFDAARGVIRWAFVENGKDDEGNSGGAMLGYDETLNAFYLDRGRDTHLVTDAPEGGAGVVYAAGPARVTRLEAQRSSEITVYSAPLDLGRPFEIRTHDVSAETGLWTTAAAAHVHAQVLGDDTLFAGLVSDGETESYVTRDKGLRKSSYGVKCYQKSGSALVEADPGDLDIEAAQYYETSPGSGVYFERNIYFACDVPFGGLHFVVAAPLSEIIGQGEQEYLLGDGTPLVLINDGTSYESGGYPQPFSNSGCVRWKWPRRWLPVSTVDAMTLPGGGSKFVVKYRFARATSGGTVPATLAAGADSVRPFDCRVPIQGPASAALQMYRDESEWGDAGVTIGVADDYYRVTAGDKPVQGRRFALRISGNPTSPVAVESYRIQLVTGGYAGGA